MGNRDAVEERIARRLPVTIQLGLMSIVIGLVIALPVGIYSAIRQDTAADYAGRSVAIVGLATPNFWLAMMVHALPGDLVGLVATDGNDSVHGGPAGKSGRVHHSQPDSGHRRHRCGSGTNGPAQFVSLLVGVAATWGAALSWPAPSRAAVTACAGLDGNTCS